MSRAQTFNDGVVRIYRVSDAAAPGCAPDRRPAFLWRLRYEERTVGVTRHYAAMQANDRVDLVLRCPRRPVSALDVAVPNDGRQYQVALVQYPRDVAPPCMDLTLRRLEMNYDLFESDQSGPAVGM